MINSKPCPRNLNLRTPKHIEEKVIYLRKTYHFGPRQISMYMERYHVIHKMPFRIKIVRTDNGHEFQARFHWHVMDQGIDHVYIKPGTPRLNGKVERSHRTDNEELHQLLKFTDDVDLNLKLQEWQNIYNMFRPHTAHDGKTPYEMLRLKLKAN